MARFQFQTIAGADRDDATTLTRIASAYIRIQRAADAEPYLSRALALAPSAVDAKLLLGQVYLATEGELE